MATSFEDASLKGLRVLVADDDDVTRVLLKQLLRMCHLNVVGDAKDGKAALESFRRLRPQVTCLDVQMPEMTGLEVLTAIRAEPPTAGEPPPVVIMITGTTTAAIVKSAIAAGADGIIAKPFSVAKIFEQINRGVQMAAKKVPPQQPS